MKYEAIFSDYDGTLIGDDYIVSKENKDAIQKYVKNGGKFFMSTGRILKSIYPHIMELDVDTDIAIVSQGAEIYDLKNKKMLKQTLVQLAQLKKINDFIVSQLNFDDKLTPFMYIDDEIYFMDRNEESIKMFCDILKVDVHIIKTDLYDFALKVNALPSKVLVIVDPKYRDAFIENGNKLLGEEVVFCASRDFLIEIMPKGINKGEAVKYVCEKYDIMLSDVICIGDSDNDLSMIEIAGLGVATGNAYDSVKKKAKYISTSCENSALADVINKFCLEE